MRKMYNLKYYYSIIKYNKNKKYNFILNFIYVS